MFPADPMAMGQLLEPLGLAAGPTVPTREWRDLYAALDCAVVAAIHPFYAASVREFETAGRPVVGSAPVGVEGTAAWLRAVGEACGTGSRAIAEAQNRFLPLVAAGLAKHPIRARVTLSGYEGSELLVGRLLVESGADLRYVGTACPGTAWNAEDAAWLEAHGVRVQFRASLEQDVAAMHEFGPELVVGTTPVVQQAKELGIPALYFTNLVSARPLMRAAGAGSLAQVFAAALGNRDRMARMRGFFEGVGVGHAAGVWEAEPQDRPEFREHYRRHLAKEARRRQAEAMV
jgi:chlorophyllide a reductase subunit Y